MNRESLLLTGVFRDPEKLRSAVIEAVQAEICVVESNGPFPIEGMEEALGRRASRLPWVALVLGFAGAALKIAFQVWTTSVDWPINVGGKPWDSLPAFIPVTFEVMVLLASFGAAAGFLLANRLRPGRRRRSPHPRIGDDLFAVVLRIRNSGAEAVRARDLLRRWGGEVLDSVELEEGR